MSSGPRFSVMLHLWADDDAVGWQPLVDRAIAAERAGCDGIVLAGEHVVFGENLEAYATAEAGGRTGARQPTGPDGAFLEPMATLALLAGLTSRIRMSTFVVLAALRRPIVFAKTAATVDVLSNGRIDLGVGVGWQREEYDAAGLRFEDRGRLLDHTLEVCQTLWRERRASYSSPELSFEGIHMMPKPVDPDGVPIWVSGTVNARAMQRLARFGRGWIPWGDALYAGDGLLEAIPQMRKALDALGRDPTDMPIVALLPVAHDSDGSPVAGRSMEAVERFVEAGVTDFYASLPVPADGDAAEEYLAGWTTAFRAATSS